MVVVEEEDVNKNSYHKYPHSRGEEFLDNVLEMLFYWSTWIAAALPIKGLGRSTQGTWGYVKIRLSKKLGSKMTP